MDSLIACHQFFICCTSQKEDFEVQIILVFNSSKNNLNLYEKKERLRISTTKEPVCSHHPLSLLYQLQSFGKGWWHIVNSEISQITRRTEWLPPCHSSLSQSPGEVVSLSSISPYIKKSLAGQASTNLSICDPLQFRLYITRRDVQPLQLNRLGDSSLKRQSGESLVKGTKSFISLKKQVVLTT